MTKLEINNFISKISVGEKEQRVAKGIIVYLATKHKARPVPYEQNGNNYIILSNRKFNMAITVCNTDKHRVIKIEEILVNENYRNQGLGTNLLKDTMEIARANDCIVGLWCEIKNKRGLDYYKRLGFKLVDKINDYWLEY